MKNTTLDTIVSDDIVENIFYCLSYDDDFPSPDDVIARFIEFFDEKSDFDDYESQLTTVVAQTALSFKANFADLGGGNYLFFPFEIDEVEAVRIFREGLDWYENRS